MTQATLLICGDSFESKASAASPLQSLPYRVLPASHFNSALKWLQDLEGVDLILLIPELKDKAYLAQFDKFRKKPEAFGIPVLGYLKQTDLELADSLLGFCDDFILENAQKEELLHRIRRLLKAKPVKKNRQNLEIQIGDLKISMGNYQAFKNGLELKLTPIEYKLIHFLHENKTRVLKREELLREVWGYKDLMQTRTIDTYMKRLRAKLGQEGKRIETLRGIGYRLKT